MFKMSWRLEEQIMNCTPWLIMGGPRPHSDPILVRHSDISNEIFKTVQGRSYQDITVGISTAVSLIYSVDY